MNKQYFQPFGSGEDGYTNLLREIMTTGALSTDRTGVGTKKVFGRMLKFDLSNGRLPLLTTKRVWYKGILKELLWMISGATNIRPLILQGVGIWNEWPLKHFLLDQGRLEEVGINTPAWDEEMRVFVERIKTDEEFAKIYGELGPVYGYQWRHWNTPDGRIIDQLQEAINMIRNSPNSRRIIVTAWNPSDIEEMEISGLPPCHYTYQFGVIGRKLNLLMNQRSVDCFLGLPFNIASYGMLTHLVARICDLEPGELTLSLADTHIYLNHLEQVATQLQRTTYPPPHLEVARKDSVDDYTEADFKLLDYKYHPAIQGDIAV